MKFQPTLLAAVMVAAPHLCRADALYTTTTSIDQNGTLQPMSSVTTYLKDDFERLDLSQEIGPFHTTQTILSNRAKREQITLDFQLKIYFVGESKIPAGGGETAGKSGVGTMILTLGAKFLGLETLMERPVRRYTTSMAIESSGCCGVGKSAFKSEVWMADIEPPNSNTSAQTTDWNRALAAEHPKCRIDFQRKGDVTGYEAAQRGLAVKTVTFDESGKMLMTSQITALSFDALGDEKFVVPSGFKKMSRAGYDAARTQAMMAAMRAGQK